jgi:hypothetical protein
MSEELKLGQVRQYYRGLPVKYRNRKTTDMIVLAFNEYEVIARPSDHDGPGFLRYARDEFMDWYPKVVA